METTCLSDTGKVFFRRPSARTRVAGSMFLRFMIVFLGIELEQSSMKTGSVVKRLAFDRSI